MVSEEEGMYGSLEEVMVGDGDRLNGCDGGQWKEDGEGYGICDDGGCGGWRKVVLVVGMRVVDLWLMNTAGCCQRQREVHWSRMWKGRCR